MSAVTQLSQSSLEETLSRYDIGQLERYWPAANGIENSNYFVSTLVAEAAINENEDQQAKRKRNYVFTILEQEANSKDGYVDMMLALADLGLPVAPPLPNMANEYVELTDGKPALLQPCLTGQHVYNPTVKQVCALARFVARMHKNVDAQALTLASYPRDVAWLEGHAHDMAGRLPLNDANLLTDTIEKTKSLLARSDVTALPKGLIHGDLFRDNVLFNQHGLTGVLDFHHASRGYLIYDLAIIANDWCTDSSGVLDPERTTAMLLAYHQIRPLQDAELWFFSNFALYGALNFWVSRLSVVLKTHGMAGARTKNPDEYKRIVSKHTSHSYYIDKRLFDS